MPSKYTDSNFNQIAITGPFGFPLKNTEGVDNEIRVAKKDGRYALAIKTDNAWRYFDENLKVASASTLGLIKVGSGLSIDAAGVLSATGGGGSGTITGVTAGTGLSGGGTSGTVTLTNAGVTSNVAGTGISVNAATGAVTISVSGLTVSELAANSLQTSGESFSDNDTSLMTSAAIQDKIQSFSYITLSSLSASAPITYDNSSGAFSIADHAVTLAKLPEIATARFLGRTSSSTGDVEVLTVGQVGTLLSLDNYLTAPRTVTAGGNTLATSETLAFVAGSNVTISESGGSVTIASSFTNTTDLNSLSAGSINTSNDFFGFIDADDSNASKKESIADFLTAIAGGGISAGSGQLSRDSIALGGLSNVSSSSPSTGDFLKYGGSQWEPTAVSVMTGWKLRDSSSSSNDKTVSEGKFVKIVAANSGSYGDVAFSGSTGETDDPFVVSISAPNTDRYVNAASFNTGDGVLTLTRAGSDSATVTVDLDGRFLSTLSGQTIKNLLDVHSTSPSNGQILQWNSTANYYEPVTLTSSYSWYLRDGDTTAVQVTSGKYVKLVEGTGIDIDFTDTSSGAVDDEFDVTITNTLMSSGGTIGGDTTVSGVLTANTRLVTTEIRGSSVAIKDANADLMAWFQDGSSRLYSNGYNLRLEASNELNLYNGDTAATLHINYNGTGSSTDISNSELTVVKGTGSTFNGSVTANSLQVDAHNFQSLSSSNMRITGNHSAAIGINLYASGNNRGWIYSNDSSEIGFLDTSGSWDLRKTMNSHLLVYGDGSNVAKFGSGDEWGRIEFDNFSNGVYVYTSHGNFEVDGGHWNPYGNNDTDLGIDSKRWRNLKLGNHIIGGFGARETGGTTSWDDSTNARSGQGHTLLLGNHTSGPSGTGDYFHPFSFEYSSKDGGGNMCQFAIPYIVGNGGGMYMRSRYEGGWGGWVQFHDNDNMSGIARTGNTYGSFNVTVGNNSWAGHTYSTHSSKPTWMHKDNHGDGGLYYQTSGKWAIYWNVSNDCLGVDGSTTSSSYGLYVGGAIYSTGDVVAFSDARIKTNVVTIDNPLDKVLNMRGVYYNPIDKETKEVDDRRRVGVIAQELNEVLPEAVTYAEDVDEYGVDYGKLTGVLIEAIKELKQEINELKGN